MNAVQSFFKKYHAVPGGDAGPEWKAASLESLLGWFTADAKLVSTEPRVKKQLNEVATELWRRVAAMWPTLGNLPRGSEAHNDVARIMAALAANADVLTIAAK